MEQFKYLNSDFTIRIEKEHTMMSDETAQRDSDIKARILKLLLENEGKSFGAGCLAKQLGITKHELYGWIHDLIEKGEPICFRSDPFMWHDGLHYWCAKKESDLDQMIRDVEGEIEYQYYLLEGLQKGHKKMEEIRVAHEMGGDETPLKGGDR
jgi:hypothetical protein